MIRRCIVAPTILKILAAIVGMLLLLTAPVVGQDYSARSPESLIDELASLDKPAPGIASMAIYDGFVGDGSSVQFTVGIIPNVEASVPPAMIELVRRGLPVLPVLLKHLNDERPTKLRVGGKFFSMQYFATEYDARDRRKNSSAITALSASAWFEGEYSVKIGDVCEVIIGQIVNRLLFAVRYQPSQILVVNSPIASPQLQRSILRDWGGLTQEDHMASLLADMRAGDNVRLSGAALTRLRFYYPTLYAGLSGKDLEKRRAFEATEKSSSGR